MKESNYIRYRRLKAFANRCCFYLCRIFPIKKNLISVCTFEGKGGFSKEKQKVLFCVIPTKDYFKLKEGIHNIDSEAFFVVTDAYEVLGGE